MNKWMNEFLGVLDSCDQDLSSIELPGLGTTTVGLQIVNNEKYKIKFEGGVHELYCRDGYSKFSIFLCMYFVWYENTFQRNL